MADTVAAGISIPLMEIGVAAIQDELKIFHQLLQALPASAQLRLDANGDSAAKQTNGYALSIRLALSF